MNPRTGAVLLVFCGFAVTGAQAKPRTVPDTVVAVEQGSVTLQTLGSAWLSGVWLPPDAEIGVNAGDAVEVKALPHDRYGRTPVLLYKVGTKTPLQQVLLAQGAAMIDGPMAAPAAWRKAEAQAQAARRGLWATQPLRPEQAGEHLGQKVRVRGLVSRTYKSRSMHYINFGADWKTDFSLRIPRKAWRAFGKDFAVADGSCLQARGVVFLDNGPMIELTRPEQLQAFAASNCAQQR